jgi:hypothetical protein
MTETIEPEAVGPNVFWDPIPPFADEIEAELEDGTPHSPCDRAEWQATRVRSTAALGEPIYRGDRVAWRVSEMYQDP